MAVQEQQWIVDHFGLVPDPEMSRPMKLHIPQSSAGPASPRSPVGGRLGEKLKGLKLATSPADLAAASQGMCMSPPPLSPSSPEQGLTILPALRFLSCYLPLVGCGAGGVDFPKREGPSLTV
jgi:hypothetical protein